MKIDNSLRTSNQVSNTGKTRAPTELQGNAPQNSDSKVQLSSLSGTLQQIEQTLNNVPVVDSAKVNEIKQAISDGRFQVNPNKVADGLINSVKQMLQAQPRSV